MICPYCKKEMNEGYIPTGKMAVMWIPKNFGLPLTVFSNPEYSVRLTKNPTWKAQKAEAYYCENCKIIIAPINNLD